MNSDVLKHQAAVRAVDFVRSGHIIGLGTGSTIKFVLEELTRRLADGRLHDIAGVPTSERTATLGRTLGIPLVTLDEHPFLDLAIDGADEIDPKLNLIKGLGGALLREKIVASASRELVIVADATKLVQHLGEKVPVPIEVVPFALRAVQRHLERAGHGATLRYDRETGQPYVTDEHNHILDLEGAARCDPYQLDRDLKSIPGIVEHGLFLDMAALAVIADERGVELRSRAAR